MNNKKILLFAFVLIAIVQLSVPSKMIWDRERILELGKEFKFETAPIDPADPFRGKYIVLQFKEATVLLNSDTQWIEGEQIYAVLKTDNKGFAKIDYVTREKPDFNIDYVNAKIEYVIEFPKKSLHISFPFDRFYMEESKAFDAELAYLETQLDSTKTTYALVVIKEGDAVLKHVLIDGVPIREIVIDRLQKGRNSAE